MPWKKNFSIMLTETVSFYAFFNQNEHKQKIIFENVVAKNWKPTYSDVITRTKL